MKKIMVKRLFYSTAFNGNYDENGTRAVGGTEYSGTLSDSAILDAFYEPGVYDWASPEHNCLVFKKDGRMIYIKVGTCYYEQKTLIDRLFDSIKRILRM